MVQYNPKEWFGLIFRFHKSDTFRILLPAMLSLGVYSGIVSVILLDFFKIQFKSTTILHSLLGFVISLLLVFRTNTAYDRWWEARKLWGALVNSSRNFALKIKVLFPVEEHEFCRTTLINYCISLKDHLRSEASASKLQASATVQPASFAHIEHLPVYLAGQLFSKVNELYKKGSFTGEQFLLIKDELTSLTDITGACERIRNTPIPYSYSLFIKKFIFIYTLTIPLGLLGDFGHWVIPITMFIFYALTSLEVIAEEIEDPFGFESNDLPTDEIVKKIETNVNEILEL